MRGLLLRNHDCHYKNPKILENLGDLIRLALKKGRIRASALDFNTVNFSERPLLSPAFPRAYTSANPTGLTPSDARTRAAPVFAAHPRYLRPVFVRRRTREDGVGGRAARSRRPS